LKRLGNLFEAEYSGEERWRTLAEEAGGKNI